MIFPLWGFILKRDKNRRDEKEFYIMLKRWIVGRSNAWYNWHRQLNKDFKANVELSEALVQIASIATMI